MKTFFGCGFNLLFWIVMLLLGGWIFTEARLGTYGAWLLALSVITFLAYGYDKWQSGRKGPRISELALNILSLLGGFPGGWFGMFWHQHKTKDNDIKIMLAISTVLHWLLISNGWTDLR